MNSRIPKQFLELHGKPVLWYTLNTFLQSFPDLNVVVVVANNYIKLAGDIISRFDQPERLSIAPGGDTRFHSVKNGLQDIDEPSVVFIHDAVRCLFSVNLIHRCYSTALELGNAVPAIQAVDSVRIETRDGNQSIAREQVRLIQTPQTFQGTIIRKAFEQDYDPAFTDEASMVERMGIKINLIEGESNNIKLTTPIDLLLAEKILDVAPPE